MRVVTIAGRVVLWVLSIGLACVFLLAGVPKLAGAEGTPTLGLLTAAAIVAVARRPKR